MVSRQVGSQSLSWKDVQYSSMYTLTWKPKAMERKIWRGKKKKRGAENSDLKQPVEFVIPHTPLTPGRGIHLRYSTWQNISVYFRQLVPHVSQLNINFTKWKGERDQVVPGTTSLISDDIPPQDDGSLTARNSSCNRNSLMNLNNIFCRET